MSAKATCSSRIRQGMERLGIRQADLCKTTGINKATMSQYVNGLYEPKQDKIYLIAKALNVSEAWLMGYDVPAERGHEEPQSESYYLDEDTAQLAQEIFENRDLGILMDAGRKLSPDDLKAVIAIVERMKGNE